jgi:hypothetical protein
VGGRLQFWSGIEVGGAAINAGAREWGRFSAGICLWFVSHCGVPTLVLFADFLTFAVAFGGGFRNAQLACGGNLGPRHVRPVPVPAMTRVV